MFKRFTFLSAVLALGIVSVTQGAPSRTNPSTVLIQLGVDGVTSQGGLAGVNRLIKTDATGKIDASLLPSLTIDMPVLTSTVYLDANSTAEHSTGSIAAPYTSFESALNNATGPTAYVFAPGAYSVPHDITDAVHSRIALVAINPGTVTITGAVRVNTEAPIDINVYGVHIEEIRQIAPYDITVRLHNNAGLDILYTTIPNPVFDMTVYRDPTVHSVPDGAHIKVIEGHQAKELGFVPTTPNRKLLPEDYYTVAEALETLINQEYMPAGATPGQLTYWDGTNWEAVAAGAFDEVLYGGDIPVFLKLELGGAVTGVYDNVRLASDSVDTASIIAGAVSPDKLQPLGGDVTNTYDNVCVIRIQQVPVIAPTVEHDGMALTYKNDTPQLEWVRYMRGDVYDSNSNGIVDIAETMAGIEDYYTADESHANFITHAAATNTYVSTNALTAALMPYLLSTVASNTYVSIDKLMTILGPTGFTNGMEYILAPYVDTGELEETLLPYVDNTALTAALAPYIDTNRLTTALMAYVSTNTFADTIAAYVDTNKLNNALLAYTGTNDLIAALAPYVDTNKLNNALLAYTGTNDLIAALAPYADTNKLNNALLPYVDTNKLYNILGGEYATLANLGTAVAYGETYCEEHVTTRLTDYVAISNFAAYLDQNLNHAIITNALYDELTYFPRTDKFVKTDSSRVVQQGWYTIATNFHAGHAATFEIVLDSAGRASKETLQFDVMWYGELVNTVGYIEHHGWKHEGAYRLISTNGVKIVYTDDQAYLRIELSEIEVDLQTTVFGTIDKLPELTFEYEADGTTRETETEITLPRDVFDAPGTRSGKQYMYVEDSSFGGHSLTNIGLLEAANLTVDGTPSTDYMVCDGSVPASALAVAVPPANTSSSDSVELDNFTIANWAVGTGAAFNSSGTPGSAIEDGKLKFLYNLPTPTGGATYKSRVPFPVYPSLDAGTVLRVRLEYEGAQTPVNVKLFYDEPHTFDASTPSAPTGPYVEWKQLDGVGYTDYRYFITPVTKLDADRVVVYVSSLTSGDVLYITSIQFDKCPRGDAAIGNMLTAHNIQAYDLSVDNEAYIGNGLQVDGASEINGDLVVTNTVFTDTLRAFSVGTPAYHVPSVYATDVYVSGSFYTNAAGGPVKFVRMAPVPAATNTPGQRGDVAVGNDYLYFYSEGLGEWRRIKGEAFP